VVFEFRVIVIPAYKSGGKKKGAKKFATFDVLLRERRDLRMGMVKFYC